jgi:hypothetical protein
LLASLYLFLERKLLKQGLFIPYYSFVGSIVLTAITCSLTAYFVYTPPGLVKLLEKDKRTFESIIEVSHAISEKKRPPLENSEDIKAIIQKQNVTIRQNIQNAEMKYMKLGDGKFSLSWKTNVDLDYLKKKKRLYRMYGYIFYNYEAGRCSMTYYTFEYGKNK